MCLPTKLKCSVRARSERGSRAENVHTMGILLHYMLQCRKTSFSSIRCHVTSTNPHWARVVDYSPFPLLEGRPESQQWEHYKADNANARHVTAVWLNRLIVTSRSTGRHYLKITTLLQIKHI
ncbi:hypothetical protein PYW07_013451 [Mythimna separata]|uniref:Uncharacterized protein n=1 Tax=Mythimna separata TaxID=271217 RepID=A0AAD7Y6P9_MYTSE|nr:hypothetical protein PYW07_013451 [Mythimna separata]